MRRSRAGTLALLPLACLATSCRSEFLQSKNSRDFIRFVPRPCGGRARERSHCLARRFDLQKFFRRFPEAFSDCESIFIASPVRFWLAKVLSSLARCVFGLQKFFHRLPGAFSAHKSSFVASPERFRTAKVFSSLATAHFRPAKVLSSLATACLATSCRSPFALCRIRAAILWRGNARIASPGAFSACKSSFIACPGRSATSCRNSLALRRVRAAVLQTVFENHSA